MNAPLTVGELIANLDTNLDPDSTVTIRMEGLCSHGDYDVFSARVHKVRRIERADGTVAVVLTDGAC